MHREFLVGVVMLVSGLGLGSGLERIYTGDPSWWTRLALVGYAILAGLVLGVTWSSS